MPRNEELTGRYVGADFIFDNGEDRPRVIIATIECDCDVMATIKGEVAEDELAIGMVYRFMGQWRTHHKHGRQFWFSSFTAEEPADEEAIIAYLGQCRGIGKATAYALWEEFGPDAVRCLRETPEIACKNIARFTVEKAVAASELLNRWKRTEKTKLELLGLIDGRGFPKKTINKLIEKFGADAARVIRQNPYALMLFRGCGFLKTHRMYLDLGHSPARIKSQALCGWYRIASASDGDTWYPEGVVIAEIKKKVAGAAANPQRALQLAIRGQMLSRTTQRGRNWVAESRKAASEEALAAYIRDAMRDTNLCAPILPAVKTILSDNFERWEHQYEIIKKACGGEGGISIIGGSPGTGKTTSTAALVKAAIAHYGNQFMIAAAAPTGKAAVRFSEALSNNHVDLKATTIHSLLQVESADDGWRFRHGLGDPLPHRLIFLDEMSMCDTDLMRSLFAARAPNTHLVIIGDIAQLPPVGHGAPLRDMIAAGVPYGELSEIQRNSGRIVKACKEIKERARFTPSPKLDLDAGENLVVKNLSDASEIIDWIENTVTEQEQSGLDPIWDVQVLVPVNKKSQLARKVLNERLQRLLNPNGEQVKGNPFRVGDKIINLKNGKLPSPTTIQIPWQIVFPEDWNELKYWRYLHSPDWLVTKRRQVAERAGWKCENCGKSSNNCESEFNAHHETYERLGNERLEDLKWYCRPCHEDWHKRHPTMDKDVIDEAYVANGEQGKVIKVEPARTFVEMPSPHRIIIIPHGQQNEDGDESDDDAGESKGAAGSWDLAYAISGHKSQGSEWPVVIVVLDSYGGAQRVMSRNWLYTAISRAKRICYMVGSETVAQSSCRRDALAPRKTFLKERITGEFQHPLSDHEIKNLFRLDTEILQEA